MKRSLLAILLVVIAAGWLGTLIARDPGYVLVSYSGNSLQTSLWVALGLIAAILLAGYYSIKLMRTLLNSGNLIQGWRTDRQRSRADKLTGKGLALLAE